MLILTCPCCGAVADETELAPGGEAHLKRMGPDADEAAFEAYLFHRKNPRGVHFERWRHAHGCGKWFHAARDTVTLEVFGTNRRRSPRPPKTSSGRSERGIPDSSGRARNELSPGDGRSPDRPRPAVPVHLRRDRA